MSTEALWSAHLVFFLSVVASGQVLPENPKQPVIPPTPGLLADTLTAKKFSSHEKFEYRVVEQFGFRGVLGSVISAGIAQGLDIPDAWGTHWEGYGKRFASNFGAGTARQIFAFGLDDVLHQDPRYFPSSEHGFKLRMKNVLKQVVITKKDDGAAVFASSRVASAFGAGFLANSWQPKGNGSAADGVERGALTLVGDAAFYFIQEFAPFTRNSAFRHHH